MSQIEFDFIKCEQNRLGVDAQADFALAFMMVHEVPDQRRLLGEIQACLKPDGKLLVAEPKIHVPGGVLLQGSIFFTTFSQNVSYRCRASSTSACRLLICSSKFPIIASPASGNSVPSAIRR